MTFDTASKQRPALQRFSRAGGKVKNDPEDARCDHFPHRVFLSGGHVTADPSKQAANRGQPCMQTTQGHARTITHAFMHALMHLCRRKSKHTLLAQPWMFLLACTQQEQHIAKVWTCTRVSPFNHPSPRIR